MFNLVFLLAALSLVWGLRLQSNPESAKKGNLLASMGMGLAIFATLFFEIKDQSTFNNLIWILVPISLSALIGTYVAKNVQMTSMPQMVSIFNGLGGLSAVLLSFIELYKVSSINTDTFFSYQITLIISLFIGSVAFTGSMLAFAKLDGYKWSEKLSLPYQHIINIILLLIIISFSYLYFINLFDFNYILFVLIISLIYGIFFVAPIGGADMPVVISLLNSFTGITAALTGIIFNNNVMLLGGILVGAAGTILTVLMCEAMNRSIFNVLIGGFSASGKSSKKSEDGDIKEISDSDFAVQLFYSSSVIFIPGYGLAVAQAQKICKEIQETLEKNDVEVKYAIHPVAGRMPGHMNVLLAESDVDYEQLYELERINGEFKTTDVTIIVGANDVVNPEAIENPQSPIAGMPILNAHESGTVLMIKRSLSPGYAGIKNPLFERDNTYMCFGDGKAFIEDVIVELKDA